MVERKVKALQTENEQKTCKIGDLQIEMDDLCQKYEKRTKELEQKKKKLKKQVKDF